MKVLLAEDSRVVRTLLEQALTSWGYEVVVTEDGASAWTALQAASGPSMALVDWVMPGLDGLEVCRLVRAARREPYIYIILLTGKDQRDDVVRGLEAGADDYLKKPFDNAELEARIRTGRRIVELHAQLIAAREALRQQATTDALTGLANRRTVLEALDRELERSRRLGTSCSVVFVDLDHFKQVNDTHGHAGGDTVLRHAASTMRALLRPYDLIGRFGGEEFLVVLPECDAEGGRAAAERLRAAIAGTSVAHDSATVRITCSLGVAVAGPKHDPDRDGLIAAADGAVYRAKREGRDRVVVATDDAAAGAPATAKPRPVAAAARRRSRRG